jgi:hypothetical protein
MFLLLSKLDKNGDGRFHLEELHAALATVQIMATSEFLRKMFNQIYNENQSFMANLMDDLDDVFEEDDKTVSLAELEEYLHKMRASSNDDRLVAIAKSCLRSWRWWAIFGSECLMNPVRRFLTFISTDLVAKILIIMGLSSLGRFQVYDPTEPENDWVKAIHQTLNVIGCIGFNSLYYSSAAQKFDSFEHAEKTFATVFEDRAVLQTELSREEQEERLNQVMNLDGMRTLLEKHRVYISEAALAKLFRKIDTSGSCSSKHIFLPR